jgi:prevent-host-death family protein
MANARAVGSRDLKTRLGTYLRLVQKGLRFVVTDRGRPVARLEPVEAAPDDCAARLEELAAAGKLSRPSSAPLPPFRAVVVRGGSLAATIVEERGIAVDQYYDSSALVKRWCARRFSRVRALLRTG